MKASEFHLVLRIEEFGVLHSFFFAENFQERERALPALRADAVREFHAFQMRVRAEETETCAVFLQDFLVTGRLHARMPLALAHEPENALMGMRHAKIQPREQENDAAHGGGHEEGENVELRPHRKTDNEDEEDVRHVLRILHRRAEADEGKSAEQANRPDDAPARDHHDGGPEHPEKDEGKLERLGIAQAPVR